MKNICKIEDELYIISDKEKSSYCIKECPMAGLNIDRCDCPIQGGCSNKVGTIILTTNKLLIKDGIQAIDDEFLEWFVKNPSCEFVEVKNLWIKEIASEWWEDLGLNEMETLERKNGLYGHDIGTSEDEVLSMYFEEHNLKPIPYNSTVYKIIIPQEKPKQFKDQFEFESQIINKVWDEDEPKQETLEEVGIKQYQRVLKKILSLTIFKVSLNKE